VSTPDPRTTANSPPGEHHFPPDLAKFNQISLPIRSVAANEPLIRVHSASRNAIYFGRSGNSRFDAPAGEYGGLYVALNAYGAFRETVLRLTTVKLVEIQELSKKAFSIITIDRDLQLVDLAGAGLAHIGADARLTTGSYQVSQQWSLALWKHPALVDGIYYRSRLDPSQFCILLFEDRFMDNQLIEKKIASSLIDYPELLEILNSYQYGLID
jgi:RES domain